MDTRFGLEVWYPQLQHNEKENAATINLKYSLVEHDRRFGTEEQCTKYLVDTRWGGRPTCSNCSNNHLNYYIVKRKVWQCSKCKKQFSCKKGTLMEKSQIPLTVWFKCIYLFITSKRGLSSVQMAKWIGVRQSTAWFMIQRLQEAMKYENDTVLDGIVEVDETGIGPNIQQNLRLQMAKNAHYKEQKRIHGLSKDYLKRLRKRTNTQTQVGRKKGSTKEVLAEKKRQQQELELLKGERKPYEQKIQVLGAIERNSGKLVLRVLGRSILCLNKTNVQPTLLKSVSRNSVLISDESHVYTGVNLFFKEHNRINHRKTYVSGETHTNNIENVWKHLKMMVKGTYVHLSHKHLQRYLNMYAYRWNRRGLSEAELFEKFIPNLFGKRLMYKQFLTSQGDNKTAA